MDNENIEQQLKELYKQEQQYNQMRYERRDLIVWRA